MIEYYKLVLSKYAEFNGRSRRSEYWYFALTNMLIVFGLYIVMGLGIGMESSILMGLGGGLVGIYALATLIPSIAVLVRRLHDTGRSGWWYFIALVPVVGVFILLYFLAMDSAPGANEYGPNPKTGAMAGDISSHLVD